MPARESLTPELVIEGYLRGVFPMAHGRRGGFAFYDPDPRAILPLDGFHASHSLRRRIRKGDYVLTHDRAFDEVIRQCAAPRPKHPETWISPEIAGVYCRLHTVGLAHSVEAWAGDPNETDAAALVGGLYGVALGGAFFGESMFSRATDASKVCLAHLVDHLRQGGFSLLDIQFVNPHMEQFGVVEVPRAKFQRLLRAALSEGATW